MTTDTVSTGIETKNGFHLVRELKLNAQNEVKYESIFEHDFISNTSRTYTTYQNSSTNTDQHDALNYYDENGNLVKQEMYYSDGGLSDVVEHTLNDEQLVVGVSSYFYSQKYIYHDNGMLQTNQELSFDQVLSESIVKLNAVGQPNNANHYRYDRGKEAQGGSPSSNSASSYVFNDKGQLSSINFLGNAAYIRRDISYDNNGNIVKRENIAHTGDVVLSYHYEYEASPKPRINTPLLQLQMWLR